MPGTRYEPRDFADEPAAFGKTTELTWRMPDDDVAMAQARAAELQHCCVLRMRARIQAQQRPMTLREYAAKAHTSYYRLTRMLRGEVIMRLEDIATADLILGEVSGVALASAEGEGRQAAEERRSVEEVVDVTLRRLLELQRAQQERNQRNASRPDPGRPRNQLR